MSTLCIYLDDILVMAKIAFNFFTIVNLLTQIT